HVDAGKTGGDLVTANRIDRPPRNGVVQEDEGDQIEDHYVVERSGDAQPRPVEDRVQLVGDGQDGRTVVEEKRPYLIRGQRALADDERWNATVGDEDSIDEPQPATDEDDLRNAHAQRLVLELHEGGEQH